MNWVEFNEYNTTATQLKKKTQENKDYKFTNLEKRVNVKNVISYFGVV
jgi:hypothetical protein